MSKMPSWIYIVIICILAFIIAKLYTDKTKKSVELAEVKKAHAIDSAEMATSALRYKQENAVLKKQADSNSAGLMASEARIDNLVEENKKLIKKREQGPPISNNNEAVTLAPAEFITDCKDCFSQLEKTNDSIADYKAWVNSLQNLHTSQSSLDSERISTLENEKLRLNKDYNTMRMAAEINAKMLEPRRKLKVGVGMLVNNLFIPAAVGPGLMYEDKKDRDFQIKALFGRQIYYEANIYVPFSLRKP